MRDQTRRDRQQQRRQEDRRRLARLEQSRADLGRSYERLATETAALKQRHSCHDRNLWVLAISADERFRRLWLAVCVVGVGLIALAIALAALTFGGHP